MVEMVTVPLVAWQELVAEQSKWTQAVGLATTAIPALGIDVDDPVWIMEKVLEQSEHRRSEIERLRAEMMMAKSEPMALEQTEYDRLEGRYRAEIEKQHAEIGRLRANESSLAKQTTEMGVALEAADAAFGEAETEVKRLLVDLGSCRKRASRDGKG